MPRKTNNLDYISTHNTPFSSNEKAFLDPILGADYNGSYIVVLFWNAFTDTSVFTNGKVVVFPGSLFDTGARI